MRLDIPTLALLASLIGLTQVVALAVQYRWNRSQRGVGWWLLGTLLTALACLFMPMLKVPRLAFLARVAIPMVILGLVFFYVGVMRFLGRRENLPVLAVTYALFLAAYYAGMYPQLNMGLRVLATCCATVVLCAMIAWNLLFRGNRAFLGSARFTAAAFLLHGGFDFVRIFPTLLSPPQQTYTQMAPIHVAGFVVPILTSTLWTFGFVLMVNQRLHTDVFEEKEDLRRAQEALRDSEETYRSILDASPDDITITDLEGRILLISPAASAMFGYAKGEETGRGLLEFLVPADRDRARGHLAALYQGAPQETHEYRAVRKDGTAFDVEVRSGLIPGPHGEPSKMVFVVRDSTTRRQTEREKAELEVRNRQLEKTESLGRMAGAIAHHFNNNLHSVLAGLEACRRMPAGSDPARGLAVAQEAAEHAADMSRLMLVYLGQASREQQPVDLAELCHEQTGVLRDALPEGVRLEAELPGPGLRVNANRGQLHQLLSNLVTNAWEAMAEPRGPVRLGLRLCAAADLPRVHRYPLDWQPRDQDYACLEVADSGIGIPEADHGRLFDPFFSTKFTGRGLGLPVVLGLAQAHGGAVAVTSAQGSGSVFRVYLPVIAAS